MRLRPKKIQRVMGPAEFQRQVEPEKVRTIMNRTKVEALRMEPAQSS
jgi:hypothetical protein